MRTFLHLLGAFFVATLAGCAVDMASNPNRYSLEPGVVEHLQKSQAIALKNAYTSESKAPIRMGGTTLTFDRKEMTDTAVAMLSRALEKQGIANAETAEKTVTLRIRLASLRVHGFAPVPQRTGRLFLDFRLGDGTTGTLEAENSSPADFDRVLDGAILFALRDLVKDERFVAYMNNAPRRAVPIAADPSSLQSPLPACTGDLSSWTACAGALTAADGSRYEGEFKDGKYHGKGRHTTSSGATYVGDFENGKYHGQGVATLKSGSTYTGEFRDGRMNGQITFIAANGNKYVGEFKDNRMHGQGTATRADGSVIHSGEWVNGKPVK